MPLRGQIMGGAAGAGALPSRWPICAEVEPQGLGARRLLAKLWFCFFLLAGVFFSGLAWAEASRMPQPNWEACRAMSGVAAVLEEQPRPEDAVLEVPINVAVHSFPYRRADFPNRALRSLTLTAGTSRDDAVYRDILQYVEQGLASRTFEFRLTFASENPNDWPRVFLTPASETSSLQPGSDVWFSRHLFSLYNKDGRVLVDETRGRYEFGCFDRRPTGRPIVKAPAREQPYIWWFAASRNDAADETGVRIDCRDIDPHSWAPAPRPTMSCEIRLFGPLHRIDVLMASPSTEALVRALRWLRATFPNFWPPGYL
jgi:hypothetical protein